ncbi:transmembrane protein [Basidiobolus meristosporus CBS 931.73]|uniref:Transmembrane protein n=1 Tax=Basidiobolus meristosporus CBS 931.73 TaxID=1314790 RepID=A0A1Y1Y0F4_9FUNG|nr:transmembrane protein [Basidiobolus meristosporus CBS 931.73]|eukprot:ORX91449.1 transmembrane protein [Basidiobolus meristosporus CBS 931.73]
MNNSNIIENAFGFFLVAMCWGFTNPFIKRGSEGLEKLRKDSFIKQTLAEIWFLITRWQYVLPLAINLSGSVVYYYTLGKADLSLAVPITNSLTFIFTTFAGYLLGEKVSRRDCLGMALVVVGVTLCVSSRLD